MTLAFAALLAVWLSLQASTSLESLPSASSEGHRDYCTQQETEYCDAYPMDKEPIQDTTADVDMESQTESQDETMDTGEGPVKDGGEQNQEKEGGEKVGGEEERGGEKDEGGKGTGEEDGKDKIGEGREEVEEKLGKEGGGREGASGVEGEQGKDGGGEGGSGVKGQEGEGGSGEKGQEREEEGGGGGEGGSGVGGDKGEKEGDGKEGKTDEKAEVAGGEEGDKKDAEVGEKGEPGPKGKYVEGKNGDTPKRKNSKTDNPTAESKKQKKDEAKKKQEEPLPKFPETLAGFEYSFNEKGRLRHTETGEPFEFVVRDGDHRYNQAHYEALGEVLTEYVYELLEKEGNLKRTTVPPVDASRHEPTSFVFESEDARSNEEKLMVLIHGSGVVRAGQWARRLIINDCLDSGTQLPFIRRAKEEGYGVLVLNPNRNHEEKNGKKKPIKGNSSPEQHAKYVWKHIIKHCSAKEIYIVAHSYGGKVATDLADQSKVRDAFRKRVKKIAFTDSVHSFQLQGTSTAVKEWLASHSRNWISCIDPLDQEQDTAKGTVPKVSAGTTKHEETSSHAMQSIFKYFAKEEDLD